MPPIRPELLDELLKDYQKPDDLLGQDGRKRECAAVTQLASDWWLTPSRRPMRRNPLPSRQSLRAASRVFSS